MTHHGQQALGKWWQSDKPWLQETLSPSVTTHPQWIDYVRKRVVIAGRSAKRGLPLQMGLKIGMASVSDVLSQTGQPLPLC